MFKQQIHNLIKKSLKDLGIKKMPDFSVSWPPDEKFGDYSTNVAMVAAKILKKPAMEIAELIKSKIKNQKPALSRVEGSKILEKIEVVPPGFINFFLKSEIVQKNLINILKQKGEYGCSVIGKDKTIVIDYSSPNVPKKMGVGHLRSTIIGWALRNIYKALGYKVVTDNHLGDWGTQFGALIYAYKAWGDPSTSSGQAPSTRLRAKIAKNPLDELHNLYVKFHTKEKKDASLHNKARFETKKLQEGDKENKKIWKFFRNITLKEFAKIYKILGVKFDYIYGESFYQPILDSIVKELLDKGIAKYSQGAVIIPLDKANLPPFLIQKKDGAFLYTTTDIATLSYRMEKFNPEKILYVVSNEQALHFEQLFKVAEIAGISDPGRFVHVKFGMVLGPDGKKLSTRAGKVIFLDDLIKEAIERAYAVVQEKNPALPEREKKKIAQVVGLGAIKYNDLSQNRLTDIIFDWDKMLNFTGNSGPYLQYTYARIKSILRRAKASKKYHRDLSRIRDLLKDPKEIKLLKELAKFPEVIEDTASQNNPNIIANYLYNLANDFNLFYETLAVLKADRNLRLARLALILGVATVIKNGLDLLGIETLERM